MFFLRPTDWGQLRPTKAAHAILQGGGRLGVGVTAESRRLQTADFHNYLEPTRGLNAGLLDRRFKELVLHPIVCKIWNDGMTLLQPSTSARLQLDEFKCSKCDVVFEAPTFDGYGCFLLWSATGNVAWLDALAEPTWDEVESLLKSLFGAFVERDGRPVDLLHSIYGEAACDPDPSGAPYALDRSPPCQQCGAAETGLWNEWPEKRVILDIPAVTHRVWDVLADEDKAARVTRLIEQAAATLQWAAR